MRMCRNRRRLPTVLRDRRGATSLVFAVSAIAVLAFVGLGTQGGAWYLAKRNGQNAADAAATAGALAIFWANYPSTCAPGTADATAVTAARASGANVAGQNGYTASSSVTVTINSPPASGTQTSNNCAAEAIIDQTQPSLIAGNFTGASTVAIGGRAVSGLTTVGNACLLALASTGTTMLLGGNSTTIGKGCNIAANSTSNPAVNIFGSATVTAQSIYTDGGCSGCSGGGVTLSTPAQTNQSLPVPNPFAAADTAVTGYESLSCGGGSLTAHSGTTLNPSPYNGIISSAPNPTVYCGLTETNGATIQLSPGTYFFTGSFSDQGGNLTCPSCTGNAGVTIVLLSTGGACAGSFTLNGNGTISLQAPVTNSTNSAFNGIVLYQDPHCSSGSAGAVKINGTSSMTLNGGMYFPNANGGVVINGNMSASTTCTELAANMIDTSGTASTSFDDSGCSKYGTPSAQIQAPRLLE